MKRTLTTYTLRVFGSLLLLLAACTSEFEEMNIDPNNPTQISPALLLPFAIQTTADRYWGHSTRYERLNIDAAMCWVQHLSRNIYINAEGDNYEIPLTIASATWQKMYNDALINFEKILELSAPEAAYSNPNYEAVGLIMKSFAFAYLTDVFGPIPYTDALKGTADTPVNAPAYDDMETIYAGMLADLALANEKIRIGRDAISGDILFQGDMLRWKKFANSLALRLANRQRAQAPAASEALLKKIFSDPVTYPVFTTQEDFAQLHHVDVIGSRNKMFDVFSTRSDWNISSTLIDALLQYDDARITIFAEPLADGSYRGLPNGLSDAAANEIDASRIGLYYMRPEAPSILMTSAEVRFIRAEAALAGIISEDPEVLFAEAIASSFAQYGLDMPVDYPSRLGTLNMETLMTQKWISLFGQGVEAWSEMRRTGLPKLPSPHPQATFVNEGILPTRIEYPVSEYSLNRSNLDGGISKLGGPDTMRTPLWWSK
ncbi:MAG: SusD/RagB family nutrient-binding outer membrane lipoprotein [Nitritalea sp.]